MRGTVTAIHIDTGMSSAARQAWAQFEGADSTSQRIALCWALAFAIRERQGVKDTTSHQVLASRCTASHCRTLADVLAQTRQCGYVCDVIDRSPSQLPDAAFPMVALTADGTALVLADRSLPDGKEMYTAYRVEATGRQFRAIVNTAELMAMRPGLSLVLLPLSRRSSNQQQAHDQPNPVAI